jgi:hypothetical protein
MAIILALAACLVADVEVVDDAGLRRAVAEARPGTTIRVASGEYAGGVFACDLQGEAGRPIVIRAADPSHPPVFRGGNSAFHLARVSHVELRDLVGEGATENGINVDDGGDLENPSRHVVLSGLTIRDVGPDGNRDGIKLSGLADFLVEGCTIERWGRGGSGVDMVGCRDGEVVGCTFRHGDEEGASGVQMKGGTRDVIVRRCRFEHAGQRAVNLGGSTGLAFFRPRPEGFEAKDLTVEDCTFLGSGAAVAFVGVDGATVRRNVIYRPKSWAFRILQETRDEGFVPSRGGRIEGNLIVFRADEWKGAANVGTGTAPETFGFAANAWYALDAPPRSKPTLPVAETGGVYGVEPRFIDAPAGDLRLHPDFPDPRTP